MLNAMTLKAGPERGLALIIGQVDVTIVLEVDPVLEVIGFQ